MENNEVEIWKDVSGYEGLYKVSDKGRVKSIGYGKERILKPRKYKDGYIHVSLYKNCEIKQYLVHRLVAKVFISNPENLPEVNHKDENPSNNNLENLEWCNRKYNNNYGTRTQRVTGKLSKPVLQYTKDGKFVREWKSTMDVQRNLGYSCSGISQCCLGKLNSAYNFVWTYKK